VSVRPSDLNDRPLAAKAVQARSGLFGRRIRARSVGTRRDATKERKDHLNTKSTPPPGDDLCGSTDLQDARICLLAALGVGPGEFGQEIDGRASYRTGPSLPHVRPRLYDFGLDVGWLSRGWVLFAVICRLAGQVACCV
jgi:hypothetical protein